VYKKGTGFLQDFKDFINKGNAFDLAVAFVLSTAFSAVIRSL
jgi:large-conductance mechanosensitive channel